MGLLMPDLILVVDGRVLRLHFSYTCVRACTWVGVWHDTVHIQQKYQLMQKINMPVLVG